MHSLIQWPRAKYWDKCWNPMLGCKPISPACAYCHAKRKHPYFADMLFLWDDNDVEEAKRYLESVRMLLNIERKQGRVYAETLANCEVAEVCDAIARGDKAAAVEECYDAIAVLLRIVDVLEGRQALGKQKESEAEG